MNRFFTPTPTKTSSAAETAPSKATGTPPPSQSSSSAQLEPSRLDFPVEEEEEKEGATISSSGISFGNLGRFVFGTPQPQVGVTSTASSEIEELTSDPSKELFPSSPEKEKEEKEITPAKKRLKTTPSVSTKGSIYTKEERRNYIETNARLSQRMIGWLQEYPNLRVLYDFINRVIHSNNGTWVRMEYGRTIYTQVWNPGAEESTNTFAVPLTQQQVLDTQNPKNSMDKWYRDFVNGQMVDAIEMTKTLFEMKLPGRFFQTAPPEYGNSTLFIILNHSTVSTLFTQAVQYNFFQSPDLKAWRGVTKIGMLMKMQEYNQLQRWLSNFQTFNTITRGQAVLR